MLKFDEEKQISSVRGALALRKQIEDAADLVCGRGFRNICWLGIGGTWASCLQAVCHMKERTGIETFSSNAAEYCTTGDKRIGEGTYIVLSSVTGSRRAICFYQKCGFAPDGEELVSPNCVATEIRMVLAR